MSLLRTSRHVLTALAVLLALSHPGFAASTGEPLPGTLFKATDSYVKSLLAKAGLSPRTMTDGDVAIDWHVDGTNYPGFVNLDRNPDGQIWNLRVAAILPAKPKEDPDPAMLAEFINRWNRVEGMITLYTGDDDILIASTNMPVEYGINPAEFEANGLHRFEQTLSRIRDQLDEFSSSYNSTRKKADISQLPAQAVGLLELNDGYCTASVVGADVILTAAHCLFNFAGRAVKPKRFRAAYVDGKAVVEAGVLDVFVPPEFDITRIFSANGMEGHDWAFVRLDRAIGDKTGILPIKELDSATLDRMIGSQDYQVFRVGYGSSMELTMQSDCRLAHVWKDNTYAHLCHIEPGDSGSPDLLFENGSYSIIGIDEAIIDFHDIKHANVAVSSTAFINALPEFLNHASTRDASEKSENAGTRSTR
ncbi:hypothetical protein FRZ44_16610 [Hypericibacter terrae]|uniref:Peptidase S1 domain-containing protein n=1 Tax=Hypericibacter terrae TaxID=2602015 RepID=A0A5J6MFX4_9PROT|nr:trypsin-like serine protease [Hypericibacter terrae]QEX16368.1 hypothetical protein FRZ44_16610 [Hypericibacter terrae]